ncbi:MAG: AbgT family transporter [Pseudomonadales bacterium]|nr:AbgT family transporter [Pseudomonadales bacterium]
MVMLGAGVARNVQGLFATMKARGARAKFLLTVIALVAMVGNLATDAAYVVLIPWPASSFAAAGRHPSRDCHARLYLHRRFLPPT